MIFCSKVFSYTRTSSLLPLVGSARLSAVRGRSLRFPSPALKRRQRLPFCPSRTERHCLHPRDLAMCGHCSFVTRPWRWNVFVLFFFITVQGKSLRRVGVASREESNEIKQHVEGLRMRLCIIYRQPESQTNERMPPVTMACVYENAQRQFAYFIMSVEEMRSRPLPHLSTPSGYKNERLANESNISKVRYTHRGR